MSNNLQGLILSILFSFLTLIACKSLHQNDNVQLSEVEVTETLSFGSDTFLIAKRDEVFGVTDTKGNVIIPFEYNEIDDLYGDHSICRASKSSSHDIYSLAKRKWLCRDIDEITKNGLIIVRKGVQHGAVQRSTDSLIVPIKYRKISCDLSGIYILHTKNYLNVLYRPKETNKSHFKLLNDQFEEVKVSKHSHYLATIKNDNATIYDLQKDTSFIVKDFENAWTIKHDLLCIKSNEKWQVLNISNGRKSAKFDTLFYINIYYYGIAIKNNGKWGVIHEDKIDSFRLSPVYDSIGSNADLTWKSQHFYTVYNEKNQMGIAYDNKLRVPLKYEEIYYSGYKDYFWVKEENEEDFYLYSDSPNIHIEYFSENNSYKHFNVVSKEGKECVLDLKKMEFVIPCKYDSIRVLRENRPRATKSYSFHKDSVIYFYRRDDGKISRIIDKPFKSFYKLTRGEVIIAKDFDDKFQLLSKENEITRYDSLRYDSVFAVDARYETWAVIKDGKYGVVSENIDSFYIECQYDGIKKEIDFIQRYEPLYIIKKGDKWSWVRYDKKVMFPFKFDRVEPFNRKDTTTVVIDGFKRTLHVNGEIK